MERRIAELERLVNLYNYHIKNFAPAAELELDLVNLLEKITDLAAHVRSGKVGDADLSPHYTGVFVKSKEHIGGGIFSAIKKMTKPVIYVFDEGIKK